MRGELARVEALRAGVAAPALTRLLAIERRRLVLAIDRELA